MGSFFHSPPANKDLTHYLTKPVDNKIQAFHNEKILLKLVQYIFTFNKMHIKYRLFQFVN